MPNSISHNLHELKISIIETCIRCGRNPADVTLVAVSKTKPMSAVVVASKHGQYHFGENRMQELRDKMDAIQNPELQWHMIGTVQTNKIKHIAHRVNWIHSVSKTKHLDEIEKRASSHKRTINILIQVNISGEYQKSGCDATELPAILEHATLCSYIKVRGLMGLATFTNKPEKVRPEFAQLRDLLEKYSYLNEENIQLKELSMGMSCDYSVAIEEGSTMIRVGTAIFGSRN